MMVNLITAICIISTNKTDQNPFSKAEQKQNTKYSTLGKAEILFRWKESGGNWHRNHTLNRVKTTVQLHG
jgi:hypothetical protein